MNWRYVLLAVAILAGLASGPSSLESAAASEPPIGWGSLAFLSAGTLAAMPLLLGFQVAIGNKKALRWGWYFFLIGAIYFTAAGVAACVVSAIGPGLVPHTFLFLAIGLALLAGLGLVKLMFAGRFRNGI